jgi:cytochrome bd-type quinol oxidase subunit 2
LNAPRARRHRTAIITALILGALPMVAYPLVLMANLFQMSEAPGAVRGWHDLGRWYFLLGGLLYPALYVAAFMAAWLAYKRGDSRRALQASWLPAIFLLTLVACFIAFLWVPSPHGPSR